MTDLLIVFKTDDVKIESIITIHRYIYTRRLIIKFKSYLNPQDFTSAYKIDVKANKIDVKSTYTIAD